MRHMSYPNQTLLTSPLLTILIHPAYVAGYQTDPLVLLLPMTHILPQLVSFPSLCTTSG